MAPSFLRRSSTTKSKTRDSFGDSKITPEERAKLKQHTGNIGDPILTAMREEQPFEVTNNHHEGQATVSPEMHLRDMFGNPIDEPDRSNPTRHRDERPLDTIRSFEYAATGDQYIKEQIFHERLPWEGRRGPLMNYSTAYGSSDEYDNMQADNYNTTGSSVSTTPRATIQLGNDGADDPIYSNESMEPSKQKKKKGLFGRSKK
ncbi:hypothetical protein V1512DRAFT_218960 [Lipomyces arxii]|uniref:uncharacterized protein n=1 Tax=Lipomyces arxii TaxID=56418 RepID=UPI0034CE1A05